MPNPFEIETQEKLNWCWAAVSATVARYFFPDTTVQQCQIANEVLSLPAAGVNACTAFSAATCDLPAALDDALSKVNALLPTPLSSQTSSGRIPFKKVQEQIDSGLPVCVRIQWFNEPRGHFVIISGYSVGQSGDQWVDVKDPFYEDSTAPYDGLVSAYLDAGTWSDTYLVKQP